MSKDVVSDNTPTDKALSSFTHNMDAWLVLRNKKTKQGLKLSENSLKLMTMHTSKVLGFPFVSVFGANCLPHPKANETCRG